MCHYDPQILLQSKNKAKKLDRIYTFMYSADRYLIMLSRLHRFSHKAVFLALCGFFYLAALTYGAGYKVSGKMSTEKFQGTNIVVTHLEDFDVSAIDDKWLLAVVRTNGQHEILGSDGQNVFDLLMDSMDSRKPSFCSVHKGNLPIQTTVLPSLTWLAYCSADFMKSRATNGNIILPIPWMPSAAFPLAHIYKAKYEPISDNVSLPRSLEYKVDGELMNAVRRGEFKTVTPSNISRRDQAVFGLSQHIEGTTEAVYQVTQTTQFTGVTLPSKYSFNVYRYEMKTNGAVQQIPWWRVMVAVTNVESIKTLNPYPRLLDGFPSNTSVADHRFYNRTQGIVGFLSYRATNSLWLTDDNDPYLQKLLVLQSDSISLHTSRKNDSPLMVFILFMIVLASPLFFKRPRRYAASLINSLMNPGV